MGLDPEYADYAGGASCLVCEDVIFGGKTPFFVDAWVFGVFNCPGAPKTFTNGVYLLSQISPCTWNVVLPNSLTIAWVLTGEYSDFTIAWPPFQWFHHQIFSLCETTFTNQLTCGVGIAQGEKGWATLFWGPTIGL